MEQSGKIEDKLIDLAIESWRISRLFQKSIDLSDVKAAQRQINQIRYFNKKLEETLASLEMRLVSIEGEAYDSGMAATALNAADFGPDDDLFVDVMMEPIIMGPEGVRRTGTVMLRI
ncbi:hypothetical protein M3P36_04930 [Altererythrobacter sp. KTW20L]|uniref:hypothetical protein n=1 Tax=Altererythrobacter sp. KTW20L TaxID=2942210 RepID=UPI0020BFAB7F|nr:hypothetical protein [Altererythrobacter sp. KTW20L]MCL6250393.1 hypothetical protein [Altererythrobacter sp. KTW20L]